MRRLGIVCLIASILASMHAPAKAELIPYEPGGNTLPPGTVEKGQVLLQTRVFNYSDEFGGDGSYGINVGASERGSRDD